MPVVAGNPCVAPTRSDRPAIRPAEHRGLLVRAAGCSADFTAIGRTLQDEIISRMEAAA